VKDAAELCASLGHEVEEATFAIDGAGFARDFLTHVAVATAAELDLAPSVTGRPTRRTDVQTETWVLAMLGRTIPGPELALARGRLFAAARTVASFYARHDVLLTPTLGRPPIKVGELRPNRAEAALQELVARADLRALLKIPRLIEKTAERVFDFVPFTPIANVTGQPSMSVPLSWNDDGLPIGVMFTGRLGEDGLLLRLAAQLEQARPWAARTPAKGASR
jgi:amidase